MHKQHLQNIYEKTGLNLIMFPNFCFSWNYFHVRKVLIITDTHYELIQKLIQKSVEHLRSSFLRKWLTNFSCNLQLTAAVYNLQLSDVIYGCKWTVIDATLKLLTYIPQLLELLEFCNIQVWCLIKRRYL